MCAVFRLIELVDNFYHLQLPALLSMNALFQTILKRLPLSGTGIAIGCTFARSPVIRVGAVAIATLLTTTACEQFSPAPVELENSDTVEIGGLSTIEFRGTIISALPETAPMIEPKKVELGRLLFWDPVLSGDKDVACATCHLPSHGYGDGLARSIGVGGMGRGTQRVQGELQPVPRNAQSVVNSFWNGINEVGVFDPQNAPMFWDNRVKSLQAQAIEPLKSELEMRGTNFTEDTIIPELLSRLNNIPEYKELFKEAYASEPITEDQLTDAIASFQSTIIANNAPFDRWMRGDSDAMSERQISGMQEFVIAGCANCHSGPMFSDFELHVLGTQEADGLTEPDEGDGTFAFRTPMLRQLAFTAPYFHGGQFSNLDDVIEFYDEPSRSSNPNVPTADLDPDFLSLPETDGELGRLIEAFLDALNDPDFDKTIPEQVPSGLLPGGQ